MNLNRHTMKSIFRDLAQVCHVILFPIALLLISAKALSQESPSLEISENIYRYMKDKDLKLWSILHDTIIETKRPVLFLDNEIIDPNEIIGSYSMTPTKYLYARRDDRQGNYIENELVDNSKEFNNYGLSEIIYFIYKKDSTGKLYAIEERNVKHITNFIQTQELMKIVQKQGFKIYETKADYYENYYFIKSKVCEIKLDNWTYNGLKKNPSYIATLDNHQMKLDALIKQTIPHSKTLDKYLGLYRIQRRKMSTANINAWRTATSQAQKLNDQIHKLDEKYAGNYSFMPLNRLSNIRENFSDNLDASKGVLGM
jgi:hypothetical protein